MRLLLTILVPIIILPVIFAGIILHTLIPPEHTRAAALVEGDIPFTFIETECTFIDTSELLFLSVPPDQLGYRCGYVVVPERHANPGGPTIRLPVAVLPASGSNPKPDPLFVVQGGPGGSAFEIFPFILPNSQIASGRDIVMINQRGTQFASPELLCEEVFDGVAELADKPYEEGVQIALDQLRECHQRLTEAGIDLSAFNSLENAHDIEAIRRVLGYETYNFYGVSYGTLLGLHVLREHPEHLRSVILDGVLPTDINFITEIAASKERAFNAMFEYCLSDPACRVEYPGLEDRLAAIVDRLNEEPVQLELQDSDTGERAKARLDGDSLVDLLFQAFYLDDPYALIPFAIAQAESGDYLFLEQLWSLVAFDRTFSEGMYHSVICSEEIQGDLGTISTGEQDPTLNRRAAEDIQSYLDICEIWGVAPLPGQVNEPVTGEVPTLLLSGYFDPITPPNFAEQAASTLANGFNITDPTGSHSVAFDDPCTFQIVQDFLEDPSLPPNNSCLSDPERYAAVVPPDAVSAPFLAPLGQLEPAALTWIGAAWILLAFVLSAFFIWPLEWLIRATRKKTIPLTSSQARTRMIGRISMLVFGLLGFIFLFSMFVFFFNLLFSNLTYLSVFALPGTARPFLFIPYFLIILAVLIVVMAVQSWRISAGPLWERIYFTLITIAAAGFITILVFQDFLVL